ncbi:MAG TPA: NAD(P)/FAD-dependent oxidoreductase [Anaerolineales bacterium]|nr:NAD(P)/FAD-dependent oxidoreductase [Anaerolineales bacterium]
MPKEFDVIIIGGGHNGLVCAAYLAKAGKRVLVLERRDVLGGAAATEEIFPGFMVNTGAADAGLFLSNITMDLNLENHGLRWLENPAVVYALHPEEPGLTLWRELERTQAEITRFSVKDGVRYPQFIRQVTRFAGILEGMLALSPPSIPEYQIGELLPWARTALKIKSLGKAEMMEFLRVLPMPAADYLDEWFDNPRLKAAIGASSVNGSFLGPRGSGTTLTLLYQAMNAGQAGFRASRFARGGIGALSTALAAAARQRGAEIRTGSEVAHILLEEGRAVGVELASGEHIRAGAVASNADPVHTLFGLVGASNLEVRTVRDVKNIRMRASLGRINLALKGLPTFPGASQGGNHERLSGHILIAPNLDYIEKAYDQAKYGQFSAKPVLDITIPSINDPSLAPNGAHLMCINAYFAPYKLKDGDWDGEKENLLKAVLDTLAKYAPDLPDLITHSQVITPLDLEREYGLTGGDIYHGQMGLDQLLMMRPIAGYGRYRSPVENLYLCGAGTHPGGGVTGAPGYNAAREILKA